MLASNVVVLSVTLLTRRWRRRWSFSETLLSRILSSICKTDSSSKKRQPGFWTTIFKQQLGMKPVLLSNILPTASSENRQPMQPVDIVMFELQLFKILHLIRLFFISKFLFPTDFVQFVVLSLTLFFLHTFTYLNLTSLIFNRTKLIELSVIWLNYNQFTISNGKFKKEHHHQDGSSRHDLSWLPQSQLRLVQQVVKSLLAQITEDLPLRLRRAWAWRYSRGVYDLEWPFRGSGCTDGPAS